MLTLGRNQGIKKQINAQLDAFHLITNITIITNSGTTFFLRTE